jgi:crotonobetainyl-CoA:carnitine CoA-transferase CaiB-like acyl-CoA transferase
VQHLGMVQNVVSARLGPQRLVCQPMTLTRTPSEMVRAAPKRGEHTQEVLGELGFAAADVAQFKARGVF